jgi:hypothetical protein
VRALQVRKQSLERARLASQQLASEVDAAFGSGAAAALAQAAAEAAAEAKPGRTSAGSDCAGEEVEKSGRSGRRSSSCSSNGGGGGDAEKSGGDPMSAWLSLCDATCEAFAHVQGDARDDGALGEGGRVKSPLGADDADDLDASAASGNGGSVGSVSGGMAASGGGRWPAAGRPQRKRGHNGASGNGSGLQVVFTSCVPGLPFDRPLLLSPCSTLPDRAAGVSLAHQPRPLAPTATTAASAATATWFELAGEVPLLARWEAARLLKLRAEADGCQLRATLRGCKDAAKDFARLAADAATSRDKGAAALAAAEAEFRSLVAKCALLRDARRKEFVAAQQQ